MCNLEKSFLMGHFVLMIIIMIFVKIILLRQFSHPEYHTMCFVLKLHYLQNLYIQYTVLWFLCLQYGEK